MTSNTALDIRTRVKAWRDGAGFGLCVGASIGMLTRAARPLSLGAYCTLAFAAIVAGLCAYPGHVRDVQIMRQIDEAERRSAAESK